MMLLLVLNVSNDTRFVTRTHAENGVGGLPPKERAGEKVVLDQMRRTSFYMLHHSSEGFRCGHANQQMDMILYASHGQHLTSIVVGDGLDVAMNRSSDFRLYPGHALMSCPDKMQEGSILDMRHACFSAPQGARFSGPWVRSTSSGGL